MDNPVVQFLLSDWTKLVVVILELALFTTAAVLGFVIYASVRGRVWLKLWVGLSILAVHRFISVFYAAMLVPHLPPDVVSGLFLAQTVPSMAVGVFLTWSLAQMTRTVWAHREHAKGADLFMLTSLDELKEAAERSQKLISTISGKRPVLR